MKPSGNRAFVLKGPRAIGVLKDKLRTSLGKNADTGVTWQYYKFGFPATLWYAVVDAGENPL